MHAAVFAAAEQGRARLEGGAAVGVGGTWENKTHAHNDMNVGFFSDACQFQIFRTSHKKSCCKRRRAAAAILAHMAAPLTQTWTPSPSASN